MKLTLPEGTLSFIGRHLMLGLLKAAGANVRQLTTPRRNTQCVKLTKQHKDVVQMVSFWCSLRINKLQQIGAMKETIDEIVLNDARFLTSLAHAIEVQKDQHPAYDAWLFFNEEIQSTDFFELQQCRRGTKVAKATYVIHNEC